MLSTESRNQAEIDSNGGGDGDLDNVASAVSIETPTPDTDDAAVPVARNPALNIIKNAPGGETADLAGEHLDYTLTVQNTGNTRLTGGGGDGSERGSGQRCAGRPGPDARRRRRKKERICRENGMTEKQTKTGVLEACVARPQGLGGLIGYAADSIVSKTILDKPVGTITLFAFDAGQKLSEHTAPYDAVVQVIDGRGQLTKIKSHFC